MRPALRLLARAAPAAQLPTGLTGLRTVPTPRGTLQYLYSATLDRLANSQIPETSLYRQSVEAITRHRLALVEATVPEGWKEWEAATRALVEANKGAADAVVVGDRVFRMQDVDLEASQRDAERDLEWDGEEPEVALAKLNRMEAQTRAQMAEAEGAKEGEAFVADPFADAEVQWPAEPQWTLDQIEELENKIGAGLIEEVLEVAEGEYKLVDTMIKAKVWEDLEEKPREGQWAYFERAST